MSVYSLFFTSSCYYTRNTRIAVYVSNWKSNMGSASSVTSLKGSSLNGSEELHERQKLLIAIDSNGDVNGETPHCTVGKVSCLSANSPSSMKSELAEPATVDTIESLVPTNVKELSKETGVSCQVSYRPSQHVKRAFGKFLNYSTAIVNMVFNSIVCSCW